MSHIHWLSKMLQRQLLFIINLRSEIYGCCSRLFDVSDTILCQQSQNVTAENYSFSNLRLSIPTKARTASSLSVGMSFDAPQVLQKTLM